MAALPQRVEDLIETICREKSKPPPDAAARSKLAELNEEDALDVLQTILNSVAVKTFDGFIIHLVKEKKNMMLMKMMKRKNSVDDDGDFLSPRPPTLSLSSPDTASISPRRGRAAVISPASLTSSPLGNDSNPSKQRRTLNFSDEVITSIVEHFTGSATSASEAGADMPVERSIVSATTTVEAMTNPRVEHSFGLASTSEANAEALKSNNLSDAFAELEFLKAFLILNYIGREKLEDVLSAEKIQSLKMLEMNNFEVEIWNDFGRRICKENERRKYLDWGSGRNYTYHCHVYADGSYTFKGPFLNKTTTLLQKAIGDENVLIVKFLEDQNESTESGSNSVMSYPAFNKITEEGIIIGPRRYQFFVFKDGGREEKRKSPTSCPVKCYFINLEAFSSFFDKEFGFFPKRSIQDARSIFMHIHKASSVANYMARFSLILSKTTTLDVKLDDVNVEEIDDILCRFEDGSIAYKEPGKPHIHTDGTGFISEDLALRCPHNCFKGFVPGENSFKTLLDAAPHAQELLELSQLKSQQSEPPLLIQFRMFHRGKAIKGTVLINRLLPSNTIQVRPSMIKIRADEGLAGAPTLNRFEIVGTSNKPKRPRLSKNLIALLHFGGVPREYFLDKLEVALKDAQSILTKKRAALKIAISQDADDDLTIARMILSGLPLDEPFLQHRLSVIVKEERKNLKAGKIPINNSFYVMGTADPTHTLNDGEVCVILEHGQISGPVLVYRNPGIHPGDIHVVKATYVKALEDIVGNAKYGIFFPSKGPRSMADEIAGGDYDGDMYWVSRDPELLEYFSPSEPWKCGSLAPNSSAKEVSSLKDAVLERELFRLYLKTRFQPSKAMGIAADSWLVYMDRLLTPGVDCQIEKESLMRKINELIDKYYDALDAPKKGLKVEIPQKLIPDRYPHHMERGETAYNSKSILGEIYDKVDGYNDLDPVVVWKLPYFKEQIQKIPTARRQAWRVLYDEYRREMTAALNSSHESKNDSATTVYRTYKRILYGTGPADEADELDVSRTDWEVIRAEALAVYDAAYECAIQANDPQKCNFAWKVAGSALFKIYMEEQGEKPVCCAPSVLREVFR